MGSIAKDCPVRPWGGWRVAGGVGGLVLGLGLALVGGCKPYRACSVDTDCEAGNLCITVDEEGGERYCGRRGSVRAACNELKLLGRIAKDTKFGQQVFLGMAGGRLKLMASGLNEAWLYDVAVSAAPEETATFSPIVDPQLGAVTPANKIYMGSGALMRVVNKDPGVGITVCTWTAAGLPSCTTSTPTAIEYHNDVSPAVRLGTDNLPVGFIGANAGGSQLFYNVEYNLAVKSCTTPVPTLTGSFFGASSTRFAVAVPGDSVMTQRLLVAEASDCTLDRLTLPVEADGTQLLLGALTTQGDWLVVGTLGNAAGGAEIWVYKASGGKFSTSVEPAKVGVCASCGKQAVTAVALDGGLLAVGMPAYNKREGIVEVLRQDTGGSWVRAAATQSAMPSSDQLFGTAVAVSGSYVAVGAPGTGEVALYRCME